MLIRRSWHTTVAEWIGRFTEVGMVKIEYEFEPRWSRIRFLSKKVKTWSEIITKMNLRHILHQDGRVVKALDLSSNGRMSAWVRTPLLVHITFRRIYAMWYPLKFLSKILMLWWPNGNVISLVYQGSTECTGSVPLSSPSQTHVLSLPPSVV